MADNENKNDTPLEAEAASVPQSQQQQSPRVQVDDHSASCSYANFCRVTGTPEELIIDFGLNAQPFGVPTEPVPITQRLVTTPKNLLDASLCY